MTFELAYNILAGLLLLVAMMSGILFVLSIQRRLMVALFVPAALVLVGSGLLYRSALVGETTPIVVFLASLVASLGLITWTISHSLARGVARAQRYVKIESAYLVVDEELFPDPAQSEDYETQEHGGEHEVRGHWRESASGVKHWVRAHTRKNPNSHVRSRREQTSEDHLKQEVEINWEPDGPPVTMFVIGWRWFWQSFPVADFVPYREDTDFDIVIPIKTHHFGHHITHFSQLECPTCQQDLLQWACSCGTFEIFHQADSYWYLHPVEHLPSQVWVSDTTFAHK